MVAQETKASYKWNQTVLTRRACSTRDKQEKSDSKFVDPAGLLKRAGSKQMFEPLFSCLSLVERSLPGHNWLVPHVTCSLVAHEHLPPGRCWMPCHICLGLPVARLNSASWLHLLPSLFMQLAYHEASPVMIQRGRGGSV